MRLQATAIIPIILFISAMPGPAQLIEVTAELERDSIMIGDQVTFSIRVSAASGVIFIYPS